MNSKWWLVLVMVGTAFGQDAPPQILQMNNLPNAGVLFLEYCSNMPACVYRQAIAFGQVCSQEVADDMGYACSGDIKGTVPKGFHYAGWKCTFLDKDSTVRGSAGKDPCVGKRRNPR